MVTLPLSSTLPGHVPDTSGGTSCTTHYLALTLAFYCFWPSLKPANRPSKGRTGQAEVRRCQKPSMQPAWLPASTGWIPLTPAPQEQLFHWEAVLPKEEHRRIFGVLFRGSCSSHPIQGMLLLSKISDISTQIKVRLNVSTAEIPHGSRWRGGTPSRPSAFSPSLLKSGTKASIYNMFFRLLNLNFSAYRLRNWGLEWVMDLLKFTQQISGGARTKIQVFWFPTNSVFLQSTLATLPDL